MAAEAPAGRPLRDLVRHTAIYGSGFVATAAVGLVLVPVYTHYLTPSEYGLLALLLVLYGLMKQVYDLGFTNSVGRFFFDDDEGTDVRHMSATGLAFLFGYGGLLTALLWVLDSEVSDLLTGSSEHGELVRIVAVTLYAEALAIVPLTLIRMQERSTAFLRITVARLLTALVFGVVFVAGFEWGVRGALLGNAVPALGVLLLLVPEYRHALAGRPSRDLLKQMMAFGLPFFPVILSGWLIDASDRYILELFRSRDEVGYYSLAYRLGQVMQIAVAAFSMGWAPLRYRIYSRPDAREIYRRLATYYVVVAGVVAVALAAFAAPIVALVSPPEYASAAGVVPLIVLAYGLQGLYLLTITGMGVTKKTAPLAWISAAGAAVNIGLNLLLVPEYGMKAAAAMTAVAYALMVYGSWHYSQRVYAIDYDWGRIARVLALGVAAVAALALVGPSGVAAQLAGAVVACALYVSALRATGAVGADDVASARAWLADVRLGLRRSPPRSERS
jgi:O-antigen/teichoic acid export membrane protein